MSSKIAVYIRVSTLEQANNGFGKNLQMTKIKNLINYRFSNGDDNFVFNENLVYQDLGISGAKAEDERPGLQKMLKDIEKGKISKVIVWRLDRIARKTKLILELIEDFNKHDVEFISTDENIDTQSPTGKFFLTILGAIGEMERSLIAEKTFLGKLEAAKNGEYPFGKPKYGFIKDKPSKKLKVIEKEKLVIQKIFDLYVNENKSLNQIASILKSEKLMIKCDGRRIGKIIPETAYNGNLWVNTETQKTNKETGKKEPVAKPKEEHILIKVDKFIDDKLFGKAQKKLIENKYIHNNNNKLVQNHYFAGLMVCGECLSNYKAYASTNKAGTRRVYYRCSKSTGAKAGKEVKHICKNSQVAENKLISEVFKHIDNIIKNPKSIDKKYLKDSDAAGNIKRYQKEVDSLDKKADIEYKNIDKLYDRFDSENDERITNIITDKIEKAKSNIAIINKRINELKSYIEAEKINHQNKEVLYEFAIKLKDLDLKDLERDELIKYLRLLIEKVIVHSNTIEIIYKLDNDSDNNGDKQKSLESNNNSKLTGKDSLVELMGFEPMSREAKETLLLS